ncbi:hypothetical protein Desti_1642 [Desulfomonile tiedjei DSM 6799]|uniref:Uncharacterized protein n=1 Tax=Desulfomonile tiedjei (strain ATCC 49306 / DSM 6799 / DCB-1) TaxID=706587 RepID=I4C462_DESTA|nr:hypothetical protein Desti_1642 [Desulfomonile tiedjei DSM 6799]
MFSSRSEALLCFRSSAMDLLSSLRFEVGNRPQIPELPTMMKHRLHNFNHVRPVRAITKMNYSFTIMAKFAKEWMLTGRKTNFLQTKSGDSEKSFQIRQFSAERALVKTFSEGTAILLG